MKSKFFDDVSAGVDRRRDRSLTEPGRLWNLKNGYIDDGGRVRARPALFRLGAFTNCDGLMLYNGSLYTFAITGAAPAPSATFAGIITLPAGPAGQTTIRRVWFAQPCHTSHYVVVQFSDGVISHYYNSVRVTDANCPNTGVVCIAGGRVWCADALGNVRYSALVTAGTGAADWTTAGATGAGFVAARSQAANMGSFVIGINTYQSDVVFFFENGAQVWYPDVDSTKIFLRQRLYNIGMPASPACTLTTAQVGEDLALLSQDGIRSLSVSSNSTNRIQQDIGAPVRELPLGYQGFDLGGGNWLHSLVYPRGDILQPSADLPEAVFVTGLSQLWMVFPHVSEAQSGISATVGQPIDYSANRTAILCLGYGTKRMSWSLFNIPARAKNFVVGNGANKAYLLVNTTASAPFNPILYAVRNGAADYDGTNFNPFSVSIEYPFLDMDSPGGMKNFMAMDLVGWPVTRTAGVKFLYDPNDESKETVEQDIQLGDSRGRGVSAVEVSAPAIAPVISYTTDLNDPEGFRFSGIQLYYEDVAGPL